MNSIDSQEECIGCGKSEISHIWNEYNYCQACWELQCLNTTNYTFRDNAGNLWHLTYKKSFCWHCKRKTLHSIRECKEKNVKHVTCDEQ